MFDKLTVSPGTLLFQVLSNSHQTFNARTASDSEFLEFASSVVGVEGEDLDHWTVEERRDFLNWCLERGILVVEGGTLRTPDKSE